MRWNRWLPAVVLSLAVAAATAVLALPAAAPASPGAGPNAPAAAAGWLCSTSSAQGSCGPYDGYRPVTGTTSSTHIGNNVWSPISGWHQTLHANNPGDWQVTANMPAGNTAVVSYPSIGANYGRITNVPTPLNRFSLIRSRFSEHMHATHRTSGWAAYDIWLGKDGCSNCSSHEVMIQHDFANNGACTTLGKATFTGLRGARQHWHLCKYGSELIWKLGASERHRVSEQTGAVSVLAMLRWLVHHRYLPKDAGLWQIGYGWEICSTGGERENFRVNAFSLNVARKKSGH